jgi:acyl dehydratase
MGRYVDSFEVGEVYRSQGRTITDSDLVQFTGLSWDTNPAHTDEEFAKGSPFGHRIAHGALTLSYATGLLARSGWFDETAIAFLSIEQWDFKAAVAIGDTIRLTATVLEAKRSRSKPDRGAWRARLQITNQHGVVVQQGTFTIMLKASPQEPSA